MPNMIWLGMDVHATSITIARYDDDAPTATVQTIANEPGAIRRVVRQLPAGAAVRACYEAGPCGYELHRQLTALGVNVEPDVSGNLLHRPAPPLAALAA